jgi:hypothetical protein
VRPLLPHPVGVAGHRQHAVASRATHAGGVREREGRDREKRFVGKAGRNRFGHLHKGERLGMRTEELFERMRVWPCGIGREEGVEKGQEFFRRARRERVDRVAHDVRMHMRGKMEADRV